MNTTTVIIYFCPAIPCGTTSDYFQKYEDTLNIKFHYVNSIHELFPLLSDHTFYPDFVCIDIEHLGNVSGSDSYSLINTIHTLINCNSVRCCSSGMTKAVPTKLVAVVGENTPINTIREMSTLKEFFCISARFGSKWGFAEIHDSLTLMLAGDRSVPKCIQRLYKSKNTKQLPNSLAAAQLTKRQEQIFNIVVNRGCSNKHIAKILGLSESTIKLHMSAILKKCGVRNRTQLAVFSNST